MHCDRITNMKTINLAQLGKPNHHWESWIRGLHEAGFNIRIANPLAMELQEIFARPGDVVLLDGTLPNLHRFIAKACARCPEAHVIVATDFPSSSIYQAVMNYEGVVYFSGPLTADRFTKIVCETAAHDIPHLA